MNVRSMWRLCIETGWMPAALLIVALEYAVAVALGFSVGFQFSIPTKSYLISGLTVASFAVCAVCLYRLIRRTDRPASDLLEVVAVIVLVGLQMAVLGWLKAMLPHVTSFWADPMLADWDTTLFGTDPWRITQFLLGWATPLIDRTYVTWAPVKFATLLALAVAPPSDLRSRAFVAYFIMVAVSAIGQYALPSAGPVFYERVGFGDRFAELPVQPWVAITVSYLWDSYQHTTSSLGGGISAMPSLHVAVALWVALVVRACFPKLSAVGFTYFGLIFIGSFHLGWHYAVDAVAAVMIGVAAWLIAGISNFTASRPRIALAG